MRKNIRRPDCQDATGRIQHRLTEINTDFPWCYNDALVLIKEGLPFLSTSKMGMMSVRISRVVRPLLNASVGGEIPSMAFWKPRTRPDSSYYQHSDRQHTSR